VYSKSLLSQEARVEELGVGILQEMVGLEGVPAFRFWPDN
jgi:hypothetical protein